MLEEIPSFTFIWCIAQLSLHLCKGFCLTMLCKSWILAMQCRGLWLALLRQWVLFQVMLYQTMHLAVLVIKNLF